jgi:hypothetical protein
MKKRKPLVPSLPGKLGRMTRQQLDAESNQYDAEFSGTSARRIANAKPHPRKRGRAAKAGRAPISITPHLCAELNVADEQIDRGEFVDFDVFAREMRRKYCGK